MIYSDFKGLKLSKLGFGTMRLPLLEDGKSIDRITVAAMTELAINNGINYFDTAAPYHGGYSEFAIGEALKKYPRGKWFLADKYPGHQHCDNFTPERTFEEQLDRCGVDYFDFYLLHNVCENSYETYMSPQWGIVEYFVKQKRAGRIKHLGFSSHADLPTLEAFLDSPFGAEMEFCQIQLNYLDWNLQKAKEKCALLNSRGLPIWVMEPVRGGKLAKLNEEDTDKLKNVRPDESVAAWAFRWLQSLPGVTVILSGMSSIAQMEDNIKTFEAEKPLSLKENELLMGIAEGLQTPVPCTSCRYCCDGCPQELDIPTLIAAYNDLSIGMNFTPLMRVESMPKEKHPSNCLRCGACAQICPQGINVPEVLEKFTELLGRYPSWAEICKQRAAEASALSALKNKK